MENNLIWINGHLRSENKISILSHSLHYGSTIFEGIRFYKTENGSAIFRLNDHIERFFYSAIRFGISLPYSKDELITAIIKTIKANSLSSGYIRPIAFFESGNMDLQPVSSNLCVAIAVWHWDPPLGENAISLMTSTIRKTPPNSTIISAKFSGHYANSILARQEAKRFGFQDALLLDHEGFIAEGPGANFFAIKKGVLITPSEKKIFPGITRDSILKIAEDLCLKTKIYDIKPEEILSFSEAFYVGTAMELISIDSIDGFKIGAITPISDQLKNIYKSIVNGKNLKYKDWLTYI